jgi:hypothetical protein
VDPEPSEEQKGVFEEIDSAEVVVVIFSALGQCLVMDGRHTNEEPPEMSVSPPLGSGKRRLRELNQARPNIPEAQRLVGIPWGGSVNALVRSGVWDRLVKRMVESGFEGLEETCQGRLDRLYEWERTAVVTMIRGQGPFRTLWPRSSGRQ